MIPDRLSLLQSLLRRALAKARNERESFILDSCGEDTELRRDLDMLLDCHEQHTGVLEVPVIRAGELEATLPVAASEGLVQTIGRFEVLGSLGMGGMGEVLLARDPRLGRTLALKLLPSDIVQDAEHRLRFEREARAASALNHPCICAVYEVGETSDGRPFIAMEHVHGKTLRQRLARGPLPLEEALAAMRQASEALGAAHDVGIVHRDLKPENLMIRADGYLKVLDFGIAKLLESEKSESDGDEPLRTAPGSLVGTVPYMSPEQARGHSVDARTDVWSLGAVLYELLCGDRPFWGATAGDVIAAILLTEPVPLATKVAGIPADVVRVVERALRKDAGERYPNAGELARELKQLEQSIALGRIAQPGAGLSTAVIPKLEFPTVTHLATTLPNRPTNLPARTSRLIGRERELVEVTAGLRDGGGNRMLTLTGPGGTGKTRLAVEAGRLLLADFADGVFAVDLASLPDPQLLAAHIAQVLGLRQAAGTSLDDQLEQYLSDRHMLLVLDNFEHLLTGAPMVARLLGASPRLRVLVTSRALLRLSVESEYRVEPLDVPAETRRLSLGEIERTAAVALFVERARDRQPSFTLTAENAEAVVGICRRLEGLPLALELAAARVTLLSPHVLLPRLEQQLKLLVGGARDVPLRQQTMRGAVQWSYDLLEPAEQTLLRRLAVFRAGATLGAAEAVCGGGGLEVLDGLASLVEKSLLRQRNQNNGESRFRMLEVVREFALEALDSSGESHAALEAHANYYLQLAEEAEPGLRGAEQATWLARMEAEHDNVRAALGWLLEEDADACLRLATAFRGVWRLHGPFREGQQWLDAALGRSHKAPAVVRSMALGGAGSLAQHLGDLDAARRYFDESLRVGRKAGDKRQVGLASYSLGTLALQQGDLAMARACMEESLAWSRDLGDCSVIGASSNALGEIARLEGALDEARAHYEEALAVSRQAGLQSGVSTALGNLGAVACEVGDLATASAVYREALLIEQALSSRDGISFCLEGLAMVATGQKAFERAARLGGAAEAMREAIGSPLLQLEKRQHDVWATTLREALETEAFEEAWNQGREMALDQANHLALEDEPPRRQRQPRDPE